jgi:hypothetical protein
MKKYTEKVHAKRLLAILASPNPCIKCPGSSYYSEEGSPAHGACFVCTNFIDHPKIGTGMFMCPCVYLGEEEAIKSTWIALEEKGYI